MTILQDRLLEMLAYEAFLRRAAELDQPFMLKGSYLTRQYFRNPLDRLPADLDWVYLDKLTDVADARSKFDAWVLSVTELQKNDGVRFRSFKENTFWRMIDYAMADDFPTVNTDLVCWVDGEEFPWFRLDISFNLDIEVPPVPLLYTPLRGETFVLPYSVPLALQLSWKIHQTLVRPRFKDLFDLMHLLQHPDFNDEVREQMVQALVNECSVDNIDVNRFRFFLESDLSKLFPKNSLKATWNCWRHGLGGESYLSNILSYDKAQYITDVSKLPENLSAFEEQLAIVLYKSDLNNDLMNHLPKPQRHKRKNYG